MGHRRMKPVRAPRRKPGSRVHSELAAGIGRRILAGTYPPGSLLPNEAEWGLVFGAVAGLPSQDRFARRTTGALEPAGSRRDGLAPRGAR